jgi:hypothetical protein
MALEEIHLPRLDGFTALVDPKGVSSITFAQWWDSVAGQLEAGINGVIEAQNAAAAADAKAVTADGKAVAAQTTADTAQATGEAAQGTADGAVADAATAQTRADDAYDLAGTKVTQDQVSAPSYSAYGGQTISNPPTQAEVQTLDDATTAIATALHSVISKLQTANVFS